MPRSVKIGLVIQKKLSMYCQVPEVFMDINEEYGLWFFFLIFMRSHIFLLQCKKLLISIFPLFSVTFGAVAIFNQAFVKLIGPDRVNICLLCVN